MTLTEYSLKLKKKEIHIFLFIFASYFVFVSQFMWIPSRSRRSRFLLNEANFLGSKFKFISIQKNSFRKSQAFSIDLEQLDLLSVMEIRIKWQDCNRMNILKYIRENIKFKTWKCKKLENFVFNNKNLKLFWSSFSKF